MNRWTTIKYRDFYDLPRIFVAETENGVFLFDCPFNVEKDGYEDAYRIYEMPKLDKKALADSWENLPGKATRLLGEVPTHAVEFDPTLRQQVNLNILNRFDV